jgi:predicted nucleotidyltransferase
MNVAVMLHADTPLPTAALAHSSQLAYTPAASALSTLEKRRIVRRTSRAGAIEYEPDRASLYYPMAYATALVDLPIVEALHSQRLVAAFVYGSLAIPGGGTRNSDLDLLVVAEVKDRAAAVDRLTEVGGRIGRPIDPFFVTPEQLARAIRRKDEHVLNALQGQRIYGDV